MEVKPGYKQTEVGVIPDEWDVQQLGELCEYQNGTSLEHLFTTHEGLKVISIGNYSVTGSFQDNGVFIDWKDRKRVEKFVLRRNDLTMSLNDKTSVGAIIGRVLLIEQDDRFVFNQRTMRLRPKANVSPAFLHFLINADRAHSAIVSLAKPGTQIYVNTDDVIGLKLPVPSPSEQHAVAEVLSDVDALLGGLDRLIAKKRDLKQGAMQQLLSPKPSWATSKLESIADVIDPHPSHRAPDEVGNGIPFLGIGDLNESGDLVGTKLRLVAPSVFDEHHARYDISEELIGLGRVASIGKVVRLKPIGKKYAISPTLGVIRGTKVRRNYLLYALKSRAVSDQFRQVMSGSTRSSVGMIVLRQLNIDHPSNESEQAAIAEVLSDMDAELAALEQRREKTRNLKQAMMQELLTGRTRLI